ncbi:MAG TPA: hypothetical protein VF494_01045 [Candidatus Limnocylindrales bacterium]
MSYWLLALLLVGFGIVTSFSIGPPFLLLGLVMLVLGPFRTRARLFWPALLGSVAFVLVAFLVTPFSCEATSTIGGGSYTVCRSVIGPTWSGPGIYNPPPEASWLAILAGLGVGVVIAALTFAAHRLRRWITPPASGDGSEPRAPTGT